MTTNLWSILYCIWFRGNNDTVLEQAEKRYNDIPIDTRFPTLETMDQAWTYMNTRQRAFNTRVIQLQQKKHVLSQYTVASKNTFIIYAIVLWTRYLIYQHFAVIIVFGNSWGWGWGWWRWLYFGVLIAVYEWRGSWYWILLCPPGVNRTSMISTPRACAWLVCGT